MANETLTFKAKLRELFPPDHLDTPWLLRLAIIRDDIRHGLRELSAKAGTLWERVFVVRWLSIAIGEAEAIFSGHEVRKRLNDAELDQEFVALFREAILAVEQAYALVKPIRDGLGGHVRPTNVAQGRKRKSRHERHSRSLRGESASVREDPTLTAIRTFGDDVYSVAIDVATGRNTDLRGLTAASFVFVWPDVKTPGEYLAKHHALFDSIETALTPIVHGIDTLLYLHWSKLGIAAH